MHTRATLATALLSVVALVPSAVAAESPATRPGTDGPLSSRLSMLAEPDLADATGAEQAEALGLARHGAGSLLHDHGAPVVEIRVANRTRGRVDGVESAGGDVTHVSTEYRTITAAVNERSLESVAAAPGVQSVTEVLEPMLAEASETDSRAAVSTCAGSVTSEADTQLKAALARAQFNVDGTGVKVGVLSDSYDRDTGDSRSAAQDVASGDLPGTSNPCGRTTPVEVLDDPLSMSDGPSDEGRGMLQLVHDLAPGADLAFATAFTGETAFADNIRALADAGADVIVDDVSYFAEPMFQDGVIADAVNDVTAQGVVYYSSAGNNNIIDSGNDVGSWEAPAFRLSELSPSCPTETPDYATTCMNFDPAGDDNTYGIRLGDDRTLTIELQWAQPQSGVTTDLDMYLLGTGATSIPKSENFNVSNTQKPYEALTYTNTSGAAKNLDLVINRCDTDCDSDGGDSETPRLKLIFLENGEADVVPTEYTTSSDGDVVGPTIFGHNGAGNAMSTAAVPYDDSATVEEYSSRGPVTHYFEPVDGTTPAAELSSPQVLDKPDVAATDGALTTFFGNSSNRFYGTSAAAPHAAAVAALQLDANSAQTVAEVKDAQTSTAAAAGAFEHTAAGAGLVNALGAVEANPPAPPTVSVPSLGTTNQTPSFSFTTTGDLSSVTCSIDGGTAEACSSPYTPAAALAEGQHTLAVAVSDYFGQSASGSGTVTVDATAPTQLKLSKPKRKTTRKKVKFTFSSEPGATFECKLDRKAPRGCTSPTRAKAKRFGNHKFTVQAFDAVGNAGVKKTARWKRVKERR